jgi:hypothetical protein
MDRKSIQGARKAGFFADDPLEPSFHLGAPDFTFVTKDVKFHIRNRKRTALPLSTAARRQG